MDRIPDERLKTAVHHSESPTAMLAMVAIVPLALLAIVVSLTSFLILPAIVLLAVYLTGRIIEARLLGGAIEVNSDNFPEIAHDIDDVAGALGYDKSVRGFIIQDGEINAALWRVFGRRYIAFNSSLVVAMTQDERRFIIGRFVGALKARHLRFHEASTLINSFENLAILNVLILPYLRASVYTGDRFGALVLDDEQSSMTAIDKLLIGNELSALVSRAGIDSQARRLRQSPFRLISVLLSPHPHMTDRYLELDAFLSGGSAPPPPTVAPQPAWPPPPAPG